MNYNPVLEALRERLVSDPGSDDVKSGTFELLPPAEIEEE